MDRNQIILNLIAEGSIIVDAEAGKVYSMRERHGRVRKEPKEYTKKNHAGYIQWTKNLGGKWISMRASRVIWIAVNGPIPDGYEVDHENRVRDDNRIGNLRLVTKSQNCLYREEAARRCP